MEKTTYTHWVGIDEFNRLVAGKRTLAWVQNQVNKMNLGLNESGKSRQYGTIQVNCLNPKDLEKREYAIFKVHGITPGFPGIEDMMRLGSQPWDSYYIMELGDMLELVFELKAA